MLKRLGRFRKGNIVIDGAMFMIILFVFVMVSYFGYKIWVDMSPMIEADITNNDSQVAFDEVGDRYPSVFTGLIVLVLIGFWSFMIVAAFISDSHPIMFVFAVLLAIFVMIAGAILGNFYEDFFTDAEYSGLTASFLIPHFIMSHLLEITLVILLSGIVVAYARSRS